MKKSIRNMMVSLVLLFSVLFSGNFNIKTYANETTDEIFNSWENTANGYMCPYVDVSIDDILLYCHSIVQDKKGTLYTDKQQVSLMFEYTGFNSVDTFADYVQNNIFYPLMAVYPNTSYTAGVNVKYAQAHYGEEVFYYAIIVINVNGSLAEYSTSEEEQIQLASMINQLAKEAQEYSFIKKQQLEYVFNYLRENVTYGANNERAVTGYGALIDKVAVCQGYSMVIQDVCYLLDIPCIMNFSNQDNHGWNSVYFNDKWNFIDATNGYFCSPEEDEISEKLSMHHFDKEMISMVQNSILNFRNSITEEYETGDVDNNGTIDSSDALLTLNYVTGNLEITDKAIKYADFDGNGVIESSDALSILQKVVGNI